MSNDKSREEFIDWLADVHGLESEWQEERNCFKDFPAHLAFQAWQASRESMVIKLNPPHTDYENYRDSEVDGASKYYDQARKAIEAAGLKVNP